MGGFTGVLGALRCPPAWLTAETPRWHRRHDFGGLVQHGKVGFLILLHRNFKSGTELCTERRVPLTVGSGHVPVKLALLGVFWSRTPPLAVPPAPVIGQFWPRPCPETHPHLAYSHEQVGKIVQEGGGAAHKAIRPFEESPAL